MAVHGIIQFIHLFDLDLAGGCRGRPWQRSSGKCTGEALSSCSQGAPWFACRFAVSVHMYTVTVVPSALTR